MSNFQFLRIMTRDRSPINSVKDSCIKKLGEVLNGYDKRSLKTISQEDCA